MTLAGVVAQLIGLYLAQLIGLYLATMLLPDREIDSPDDIILTQLAISLILTGAIASLTYYIVAKHIALKRKRLLTSVKFKPRSSH